MNNIQNYNSDASAENGTKPFVGGSTVKPDCSRHKKEVAGVTDMKQLAEMIGDLHYETLSDFLLELAEKIYKDGQNDFLNGRRMLSNRLFEAQYNIAKAHEFINQAWEISKPFMK